MVKRFTKTLEDFQCEHCGQGVRGDGYTNHCPHCLWSKHVDINPGDRACNCAGLMRPVAIEVKGQEHIITHRCVECQFTRRQRASQVDNIEQIIELSTAPLLD